MIITLVHGKAESERDLQDLLGLQSCNEFCKMDPKGTALYRLREESSMCPQDGFETQTVMLFSDWDDTMICSGYSDKIKDKFKAELGGVDRTLPHNVFYPGVLRLYNWIAPYMILLSANPSGEEDQRCKKSKTIRDFVKTHSNIPHPTVVRVLRGTKKSLGRFEVYGREKVRKLKEFAEHNVKKLETSPKKVFIGDNGQGDIISGKDAIFGSQKLLDYALIHVVTSTAAIEVDESKWKCDDCDAKFLKDGLKFFPSQEKGVYIFRTYIEAAAIAENLQLTPQSFNLCNFKNNVTEELEKYNDIIQNKNAAFWHPDHKENFNVKAFSPSKEIEINNHFSAIQAKLDACETKGTQDEDSMSVLM
jgi:hypothetical protein